MHRLKPPLETSVFTRFNLQRLSYLQLLPSGARNLPPAPHPSLYLGLRGTLMPRKSRSARRSRETPAKGVPQASVPGVRSRAVSTLPRELADFLVEFSIVLHKRSMYPPGHPHLKDSAERFARRLNALLGNRDSVTLGVARNRLVIETVTTDPKN